jgi:hypothetical protein
MESAGLLRIPGQGIATEVDISELVKVGVLAAHPEDRNEVLIRVLGGKAAGQFDRVEDLIDKIEMPREDRGLVGCADRKGRLFGEQVDVRLNGRDRLDGSILFLQGADEGSPVDGMGLPRFQGIIQAFGVGRMGIKWPQRIRLGEVVGDDTGKIAGLITG